MHTNIDRYIDIQIQIHTQIENPPFYYWLHQISQGAWPSLKFHCLPSVYLPFDSHLHSDPKVFSFHHPPLQKSLGLTFNESPTKTLQCIQGQGQHFLSNIQSSVQYDPEQFLFCFPRGTDVLAVLQTCLSLPYSHALLHDISFRRRFKSHLLHYALCKIFYKWDMNKHFNNTTCALFLFSITNCYKAMHIWIVNRFLKSLSLHWHRLYSLHIVIPYDPCHPHQGPHSKTGTERYEGHITPQR